jgi:hypothetical protein
VNAVDGRKAKPGISRVYVVDNTRDDRLKGIGTTSLLVRELICRARPPSLTKRCLTLDVIERRFLGIGIESLATVVHIV